MHYNGNKKRATVHPSIVYNEKYAKKIRPLGVCVHLRRSSQRSGMFLRRAVPITKEWEIKHVDRSESEQSSRPPLCIQSTHQQQQQRWAQAIAL